MKAPIETKVIAAAGGAGLGGASGTFILWLLGVLCWGNSPAADKATEAVAAVPQPVAALIVIVVALIGAAVGGYEAPHTSRPDLEAAARLSVNTDALKAGAPVEVKGSADVTGALTSGPADPTAPAATPGA